MSIAGHVTQKLHNEEVGPAEVELHMVNLTSRTISLINRLNTF